MAPTHWMARAGGLAAVALAAGLAAGTVQAQASRGELLYTTHCIGCHETQMHWRDHRVATDWPRLRAEVRRWQDAASLGWNEADILEVTRHLNDRIYRFKQTDDIVSWLPAGRARQGLPRRL